MGRQRKSAAARKKSSARERAGAGADDSRAELPAGITPLGAFEVEGGESRSLAWSPDGRTLAVGLMDGRVQLWEVPDAAAGAARLADTCVPGPLVEAIDGYVKALAWAPDGRRLVVGGRSSSVAVLDVENRADRGETACAAAKTAAFDVKMNWVDAMAWSPRLDSDSRATGTLAVVGNSKIVMLLDTETGREVARLEGHNERIACVAWRADGQKLVSGEIGNTAAVWDAESGQLLRRLTGHGGYVVGATWTADGRRVVTSSYDSTLRVWDAETGEQTAVLEGHSDHVWSVTIDATGRLVASRGQHDKTVRIWRLDTFEPVAVISDVPDAYFQTLAFHPDRPLLAALSVEDRGVRLWELDIDALLGAAPVADSVRYANAKVVLVGDTGVGKSGMRERLVRDAFIPTASTHARVVATLDFDSISDPDDKGFPIDREVLLWDLAGQPGYRLVNQLSLDDAAVALVLFDARSETDPFSAARFWAKALDQSRSNSGLQRFLVAARVDRGGVGVSQQRIDEFCQQHNFDGFFRTSALTGEGCEELKRTVMEAVDWTKLPIISSSRLLTDIREFVKQLDERRRLTTVNGMWEEFCRMGTPARPESPDSAGTGKSAHPTDYSLDEFASCLRRLHQTDVIELLDYGTGTDNEAPGPAVDVLLDPTRVDAYGSAIVNAARDEPDGLGHLSETEILTGEFPLEADERVLDTRASGPGSDAQSDRGSEPERKVLVSVFEQFLEREIALRERVDGVDYLVFPSQYQREAPFPGTTSYGIRYDFAGAIDNIFATLVVRLAHHTGFQDRDFYRNAARYDAKEGGRGLILFEDQGDGRGRMSVFFEDNAPESVQQLFLQYVYTHLQRKAQPGSIVRKRAYHCPACGYLFDDEVVERRLQRGDDEMTCSDCDTRSPLYDLLLNDEGIHHESIGHIDADARAAMHRQLAVTAIHGKKRAGSFDVAVIYGPPDRASAVWLAEALQGLGLRVWIDVWQRGPEIDPLSKLEEIEPGIRSVVACVGNASCCDVPEQDRFVERLHSRGANVTVAILPQGESLPKNIRKPESVSEHNQFDLRWLDEDEFEPLDELINRLFSRRPEGSSTERTRNVVVSKLQDERRRGTRLDDSVIVQFKVTLPETRDRNLVRELADSFRAQLAEVINMPAAFVTVTRALASQNVVQLQFANRADALRLFAMVRTGDPFMADVLERWSIDVEEFQQDNESTEADVRSQLTRPTLSAPDAAELAADAIHDRVGRRVTEVRLENFRCFESLTLNLNRQSSLMGSWTCLAGINGAGKTSVLQAICLALVGRTIAIDIGLGILERTQRLSDGTRLPAEVEVTFKDGPKRDYRRGLTIHGDDIRTTGQHAEPWLVLTYGATRNLSNRLDPSSSNEGATARRQMTLFDPYARVASAKARLEFVNPNEPFFGLFLELLKQVFPDELRFELHSGKPRFKVEDEAIDAIDLPDGFRSSVAWLADLCQAWCENNEEAAKRANLSDIEAIVLIDEIDLHLHPSLQRTLVPNLRKALPKVQWIVTTHSPLVLKCFDRNEIIALDRSEPDGVRELDRQIMGFTVDDVIRWLMHADPTSEALNEQIRDALASDDFEARRQAALLLERAPDADDLDVAVGHDVLSSLDDLDP